MNSTITRLPDGTSQDNINVAQAAIDSRNTAFSHGRGTWFDILLQQTMEISATTDEAELTDRLENVKALCDQWQEDLYSRDGEVDA